MISQEEHEACFDMTKNLAEEHGLTILETALILNWSVLEGLYYRLEDIKDAIRERM